MPPHPNRTIKIITAKNKEKIQLYGGAAANRLGLSTQVPMYKTFHTNGIMREIKIAGTKIYSFIWIMLNYFNILELISHCFSRNVLSR
ncbi:hypothetical protein B9T29_11470 [Acinetobacter sp. ANC 3903]|nr:hypothetical protein B9T29_11470 [Acinetobacter sp. ANC 3903]